MSFYKTTYSIGTVSPTFSSNQSYFVEVSCLHAKIVLLGEKGARFLVSTVPTSFLIQTYHMLASIVILDTTKHFFQCHSLSYMDEPLIVTGKA